uniref:RBR-type E3 ubiquitin transferase n=1 Tax=Xenopus tropicalis TaxID=8364 RepID=A0A803J782_XENTR
MGMGDQHEEPHNTGNTGSSEEEADEEEEEDGGRERGQIPPASDRVSAIAYDDRELATSVDCEEHRVDSISAVHYEGPLASCYPDTPPSDRDIEAVGCQPGAGTVSRAQGGGSIAVKTRKRCSVLCTVYCVESDLSSDLPPLYHIDEGSLPELPTRASRLSSTGELALSPTSLELELSPILISNVGDSALKVMMSCRVCLEDRSLKPLPCCKKPVCDECLKRYLSSQVQLGQAEIRCPITECNKHLDESTILYSLPHDDIIKYKYFLELSRVDSSTKPCPQCKHFTTFRSKTHIPNLTKSENKLKIQCPSCQFIWCFKCHAPWHEGVNCREYKKGDKLLRHWANEIEHGQRNAQKCPRCKSDPTAKAMVHRELPKHQRDLIVKRYHSGEGYKRISKAFDIPWNTVKSVIKWRKYGTTVTLPRTGHPSKIDEKTRRKLVREATKRPTATLKELQEYLASTGCVVHVTTISHIFHMSGLWGRVARRKPFLTKKNIQARLHFAKTHLKSPKSMWEKVLWSDETMVELFGHNSKKICLAQKQYCTSPKEHHTHSEAWWWQHLALGLFFFSWNWGLS